MPTLHTSTATAIQVRAVRTDEQAADADRLWHAHEHAIGRAEEDLPQRAVLLAYSGEAPVAVAEVRRRGAIFALNRLALAPGADVARVQQSFMAYAHAAVHGGAA